MLSEMKINDYIDLLASDAPAPGGGSASALCGAQGAGLCAMVAALTLGKKKYEEHQELCRDVYEQARMLSERMCALIDEDTEAFNRVSAAFKLPKDTDEDKAARKTAIAEATLGATMVPLDTLHRAHDGLELAKMLIGKSNTNCASDIGVAALNLVSCARGREPRDTYLVTATMRTKASRQTAVSRQSSENMMPAVAAIPLPPLNLR